MATITIAYIAPVAPQVGRVAEICATFKRDNAACDVKTPEGEKVFEGTYYDTNVWGFDPATSLEEFMASQVAHPGIVAALRAAVANGTYEFEAFGDEALYWGEIKPAIEDQGFTVTIDGGDSSQG